MAPLVLALRQDERFGVRVVVTGQHREMLDQVNGVFGITPDHDLDIFAPGQSLTDITTRALQGLSRELEAAQPHAVLVQGDTTTTFVGALAAFYAKIPVVHAEAGLRTGNPQSPFPEEINRRLTSQLTSLHLAPTERSRRSLLGEGVKQDRVYVTGNSVIDALRFTVDRHPHVREPDLSARLTDSRRVLLVTAHRRESWGEPLRQVGRALGAPVSVLPRLRHRLPSAQKPKGSRCDRPPGGALPECSRHRAAGVPRLLRHARPGGHPSDRQWRSAGGGALPRQTRRGDAGDHRATRSARGGHGRLVGTEENRVFDAVARLIEDRGAYRRMAQVRNPYGDGHAAERTVQAISQFFGMGWGVDEFKSASAEDRQLSEAHH